MFELDYQQTIDAIVDFIKKAVHDNGFEKVVVGLSGGVDSTVVCYLLVKALGSNNVIVALLPYGDLQSAGFQDGMLVANECGISHQNVHVFDIRPAVDALTNGDKNISNERKGNIMARTRMIKLYDLAKKHKALVAGTENRTEYMLGYFTRFGDEASDIEPIQHLYKTQLYKLAAALHVPIEILQKKPTAGLYAGQTDEDEFGFTYADADIVLHNIEDKKLSKEEVIKLGVNAKTIDAVTARMRNNEFKHWTPYIVSSHNT